MPPIIFFDGFCILCNGVVDQIYLRDKKRLFRFAPLQGKTAANVLNKDEVDALESILYLDESGSYMRSNAVLRILVRMGWPYKIFGIFLIVPRFIRDGVYDFIAKRRYRWFGRRAACRVATPQDQARILE